MDTLRAYHKKEYGHEPEVIVSAPGRVVLIGEHSQYNDGYVLPVGLNRRVKVALSRRRDNSLRFYAADFDERKRTTISNLKYKREDRWANLVKGVIYSYLQMGFDFRGVNCTISGEIPIGIGLASSAAIQIAAAMAVNAVNDLDSEQTQIIESARQSEARFMGDKTSTMDLLTCFYAESNAAFFLDTRSLEYHHIPLELGQVKVLITNSNIPAHFIENEEDERDRDCMECIQALSKNNSATTLRDYTATDVRDSLGAIPETTRRRCLHIVEENQRVLDAEAALVKNDYNAFGKILSRSHESLRDLFEVSCPELDWLVKRALETPGVYGSRMAGSGYGGCTVTFIQQEAIEDYKKRLFEYERIFGFKADTFICNPESGARIEFTNR
ncbi:MAG: galactokinase [Spirochaetia bacterium]